MGLLYLCRNWRDKFLISTPGPNKYNPDKKYLSTWTIFPAWNWHNETKIKSKSNSKDKITPGPGEYNYKKDIGIGPKYTFRKRLKKSKKDNFPGPGSYNINTVVFNGPSYTMRGREKEKKSSDKDKKEKIPLKTEVSSKAEVRGFSFPKAKYFKKIKFIVPGPGHYRIPTSFDYISNLTREKGMFDPTYRYV